MPTTTPSWVQPCGIDSQELVNFVSLAMRLGVRYETLRDGIWTHPSSTEAFNEVLGVLEPLT